MDKNIGHHPKKKKKGRQKCSNVYTFFTSTLKEIKALGWDIIREIKIWIVFHR